MKKNVKCCLTCAFCTRNQNTRPKFSFNAARSKWRYEKKSLSLDERTALELGNDSFIGKEIRDREDWDKQLEIAKRQAKEQAKNNPLLFSIMPVSSLPFEDENEGERYGLPPRPAAPTEDYLSCFHEQWNEHNTSLQENRKIFLKKKKCAFYFSFKKMDNQSLPACEKNRKELQEKKRFYITNFLVILGIIITVISI